jgi:hypothetical protein
VRACLCRSNIQASVDKVGNNSGYESASIIIVAELAILSISPREKAPGDRNSQIVIKTCRQCLDFAFNAEHRLRNDPILLIAMP